jgi:steroid delta-isomerase
MVTSPRHADPRVARVVTFFERLTRDDVAHLHLIYSSDASFKDPFNEVQGHAAIATVFEHMYATLDAPHFRIDDIALAGDCCLLTWDFAFRFKGGHGVGEQHIRGASRLEFGPQGLVVSHRDYWDAAEELYEKLPLLGPLMRWLKRRASA